MYQRLFAEHGPCTGHDNAITFTVRPVSKEVRMTKSRNQHVVPTDHGWAVKTAGAQRATKVFDTQRDAIAAARQIAVNQKSEMLIHGRDGKIREKNTYGRDPYPPKG